MTYQPGTHLIVDIAAAHSESLQTYPVFQTMVDGLIAGLGLQKLGEVYHQFLPAGYTAVICLSESHLSVHTWPEYGRVNFDIYLSNHLRTNDGAVAALADAFKTFFGGKIVQEATIIR